MRAAALALAAAMIATTLADAAGCEMTTSQPQAEALGFYLVNDDCRHACVFSIWIYEESNGIDGLQRHDETADDTCDGAAGPGDTIVI